ncbi:MAG: antitoxin [Deltaproteobacteria bacterium]|jgi:antitoxin ChpS|nr:antitoxin [Deltaproteobacteria bacterium]
MYTSKLRKVGGSVMLAVPPAILEMVRLQSGSTVSLAVESGRLIVEPESKKRYSLQELLDQCDPTAPLSDADSRWAASSPVGKELV